MIQPREAVQRLKKYRPPLEGRAGKLRLDFNENTVGCSPEVARALGRALTPEALSRYPEYERGRETLARYFKVSPEEMLLTNGTDDAIKLICDTFVDPGDILVVPAPTFPVFNFFHSVAGGRTVEVRFDENFSLPIGRLLSTINRSRAAGRWVALANPNNPTGTMLPKKDLTAVLDAAPHTVILVDEAYFDFSGETVLPWIQRYPNLVVSRTFSKAFGLAALRMGCLFELADNLRRAQNPFAVNALALAAAVEAIRHPAAVRRYVAEVRRSRDEFSSWLQSRGIPYVPSHANFVLTRVGEHAPEIAGRLREEGILVRDWSYDPHLRGYLRFTIGSKPQMRRLIEELSRLEHRMDTRGGSSAWRNFVTFSQTGWFA